MNVGFSVSRTGTPRMPACTEHAWKHTRSMPQDGTRMSFSYIPYPRHANPYSCSGQSMEEIDLRSV